MKAALCLIITPGLAILTGKIEAQDFTYTTTNDTVTITRYTGAGGKVIIPSSIDGLPVHQIGEGAFYFCSSVTSRVRHAWTHPIKPRLSGGR